MAVEILLPKLGFSMNEGTVNQWLAEDGVRVEEGQPLYELETEKSVTEIEAPASGVLRILKQPGDTHEVGTTLGFIE